jgi:hypothetical protein
MERVPSVDARIIDRVLLPQGSIDEGVQSAPVPVSSDTRLKKIYIYADGVFTPQSANDYRIVRVRTDAFDLTGWIDFTHAQPSDLFQTEIRVTMAHAADVLLQRTQFSAGALASMQQMAGTNYISGNYIDVVIRQTHSTDNFVTKIPIAYQFIVESR